MKKFEEKLKECSAQRRQHQAPDETMPFRFANDVLSRLSKPEKMEFMNEGLWLRYGLRTLAGATLALVILSLMPSRTETPGRLLPPPIEHSIVNSSGLL